MKPTVIARVSLVGATDVSADIVQLCDTNWNAGYELKSSTIANKAVILVFQLRPSIEAALPPPTPEELADAAETAGIGETP